MEVPHALQTGAADLGAEVLVEERDEILFGVHVLTHLLQRRRELRVFEVHAGRWKTITSLLNWFTN